MCYEHAIDFIMPADQVFFKQFGNVSYDVFAPGEEVPEHDPHWTAPESTAIQTIL